MANPEMMREFLEKGGNKRTADKPVSAAKRVAIQKKAARPAVDTVSADNGKSAVTLPDNLPSIANAKLPETYNRAKQALATCSEVDECAEWANKTQALASYAKQSKDEELFNMAVRIRDRAIRRCGELLIEVPNKAGGGSPPTHQSQRAEIARKAGLSERQRKTAQRVANIPEETFEELVESPDPPTVGRLAKLGKKKTNGKFSKDREVFKLADRALGLVHRLVQFTETPQAVARGIVIKERKRALEESRLAIKWLQGLGRAIERGLRK